MRKLALHWKIIIGMVKYIMPSIGLTAKTKKKDMAKIYEYFFIVKKLLFIRA